MAVSAAFAFCAVAVPVATADAQGTVAVNGLVADVAGVPIAGAIVTIGGMSARSITDDAGRFSVSGITPGRVTLGVRRLGFSPLERHLAVSGGESVTRLVLNLTQLPSRVGTVVVRTSRMEYKGRLGGYYRRLQRRTGGTFISRGQIDKKSAGSLSQLLKTVPGINAFPLMSGGSAVRMRGRACRPIVWLDGVPLPAGEVDLDAFPTNTLQGIELYLGSTNAPTDFAVNDGMSNCGTILLWSRGPDTEPARPRKGVTPVDLVRLVESLVVFSADQVEKQAELANPASFNVSYPPELFAEGIGGAVVAEFVVDTAGKVEPGTFSIVTSSNPRFSAAVQLSVQNASYLPAKKDGRPVRQAVQQPFSFVPGSRNSAQAAK